MPWLTISSIQAIISFEVGARSMYFSSSGQPLIVILLIAMVGIHGRRAG
ncbi:hypothetical protein ACFQ10_46115 [Streptomyces indonesiensis]